MSVTIEEDFSDFDWDSTEGDQKQFPPVPKGWYPVRIAKAEFKTVEGKEGKFNKFALQLQILEGNPYAGRIIFEDIILNDKEGSRRRRAIIWRRLGLVQKGAKRASISEDDLVGRECAVEVEIENYTRKDGKAGQKSKVTFSGYKLIEELGAEEANEEPGAKGTSHESHAQGTGEQLGEEDVPF